MLEFFEHQNPSTFGQHESIAMDIERSASSLWLVMPRRQCLHVGEASKPDGRDGRFTSTGQHHIGIVILNGLERIAHGVRGACTGSRSGKVRSAQTMSNRDVSTGCVEHILGIVNGYSIRTFGEQTLHLLLDLVQPTDTRTD